VILDKDQPQSNIYWGGLGVSRGNDTYYTLRTLNYILGGGGFVSRLTDRIRTESGLAYSAYSTPVSYKDGGVWLASVGTRSDAVGEVVAMILDEVEKIREEPVSQSELSDALGYFLGSMPLNMETGPQLASLAVAIEFYGLGDNYLRRYPDLVTAVSPEILLDAAREYLSEDDWVLVVAGPADTLTPQLEKYGTVEVLPLNGAE
jgi:zinc protease